MAHRESPRGAGLATAFRLYPDSPHGLFIHVSIYKNERQMYRVAGFMKPPYGALFIFTNKPKLMFGRVLLHLGRFDAGAIAHELLHAALAWADRKKIKVEPDGRGYRTLGLCLTSEERLCLAHERMINQFFTRLRELRLEVTPVPAPSRARRA